MMIAISTEAKMRFILTGFDPFDGAEMNPSQQAIERIREVTSHDNQPIAADKVVLSTCCDEAWSLLQKEVARVPQGERFAIVMAGLAQTREAISLERFGLNVRTYRVADNRGHQHDEEHINKDGAEAIRTTVPVGDLRANLEAKGYHVEVSNHAGSFVCNETYYRALAKWQGAKSCAAVLFVHVPLPEKYAEKAGTDAETDVIDVYARAIEDICGFIAELDGGAG